MNPRVEKILKLPVYQRLLILGLILLLVAGGFVYFLYLPKMEEFGKLQKQNSELEAKLLEDRRIANNLPRFRDEYEKMQLRLEQALTELPNQSEIPGLLTSIAALAKSNGLDVLRFQPGKEAAKGFYAEVPVQLKLEGTFHEFVLFSQDVGGLSRIVNLGSLSLAPASKQSGSVDPNLNIDCVATTFRFLDSAAAPSNKGKQ